MNNFDSKISGHVLKIIAVITMLIDHTGIAIVKRMITDGICILSLSSAQMITLYQVLRGIGRCAFPIFCFLLVEGFVHTHDIKKYISRMLIFALISEIPYDLALRDDGITIGVHSNVYFTLLIGLISITLIDLIRQKFGQKDISKTDVVLATMLEMIVFIAAAFLAEFIDCDYGVAGVLTILILYLFREKRAMAVFLAIIALALCSSYTELYALAIAPFLIFYNGERGKQVKYFYYAFYPGHLALLAVLAYLLHLM